MNTAITNRVTMLETVSAYMDESQAVWNSMAPLQAAMTRYEVRLAEVKTAVDKHETPNGATVDKADARDALEDVTFLMCEALSVLAHTTADNDLAALTRVARSTLDRMSETELSTRATAVLAQANGHKTELQPMQVTQANIDELHDALTEFEDAKTGPRTTTATRAALTASLPGLVTEATNILRNEVDPLVNLFSRTNPDFVAGYENARQIVDRAATHQTKPEPAPPKP